MLPIFDGHNDVLLRLMRKSEPDGGVAVRTINETAHLP